MFFSMFCTLYKATAVAKCADSQCGDRQAPLPMGPLHWPLASGASAMCCQRPWAWSCAVHSKTYLKGTGIGSKSNPSTGVTLDAANASALLAVLVGSSTSATNASCALSVQRAMQQKLEYLATKVFTALSEQGVFSHHTTSQCV